MKKTGHTIEQTGLSTRNEHYPLDVLIFATGFDAFTGSLLRPEIIGSDSLPDLTERKVKWPLPPEFPAIPGSIWFRPKPAFCSTG